MKTRYLFFVMLMLQCIVRQLHATTPCQETTDCGGASPNSNYGCETGKSATGVPAYSNDGGWGNLACGTFQCVEYVERYHRTDLQGNGGEIFGNKGDGTFVDYENGTSDFAPKARDILCFSGSIYGHVAIVDSVSGNEITIIDQNRHPENALSTCTLTETNGKYSVNDCKGLGNGYAVQGWLRSPEDAATDAIEQTESDGPSRSNPASSSELEWSLSNRYHSDLHDLNPYAGYDNSTWLSGKLLGEDGAFHLWYGGTVEYANDGVPEDAWVQDYFGDSMDGAIIVHEDSAYAVQIYNHMWNVWGLHAYAGEITNNCTVNWFDIGYGPSSEFGLPITGTYYIDSNDLWRQDFQRGYIIRNPDTERVTLNCYEYATPGWAWSNTNNGYGIWDGSISASIARAYERNGAREIVGYAFDNGGSSFAHIWGGVVIQDFSGGTNDDNAIIVNLYHLDDSLMNPASVVRNGFWNYYTEHDGQLYFGAPLGDEMDTIELYGTLRGYDPSCDANESAWVGSEERVDCIQKFCGGRTGEYISMQRFDFATLCYGSSSDARGGYMVFCDPKWTEDGGAPNPACPEYEEYAQNGSGGGSGGGNSYTLSDLRLFVNSPPHGDFYGLYGGQDGYFTLDETWTGNETGWITTPYLIETAEEINNYWYDNFLADVNADNILDLILINWTTRDVAVRVGSADGFFAAPTVWMTFASVDAVVGGKVNYEVLLGDFNGDRKWEFVFYDPPRGKWYVALSSGTSFGSVKEWKREFGEEINNYWYLPFVGDFDGNGKTDIAIYDQASFYWSFAYSTGSGFGSSKIGTIRWWSYVHFVCDINGDGRDDVVAKDNDGRLYVARGNTSQGFDTGDRSVFTYLYDFAVQSTDSEYGIACTDINNNGTDDIIAWRRTLGEWWMALCSSSSCVEEISPYRIEFAEEINGMKYELITPFRNASVKTGIK